MTDVLKSAELSLIVKSCSEDIDIFRCRQLNAQKLV
jgi:hypothetical protein